jgi:hypothetical protein
MNLQSVQIKSFSKDYHLTATEKKYIRQGLAGGYTEFCSPRKTFRIEVISEKEIKVLISEWQSNDYGKRIERISQSIITLK